MHNLKLTSFAVFLSVITYGMALSSAHAIVTLNVDGTGQLNGAKNVNVGGTFFDVSFEGGSCIDVFTGCNDASDIAFNNEADALLAGNALLDQVFVDDFPILGLFDSKPNLTNTCINTFICVAMVPFVINGSGVKSVWVQ